MNTDFNSAKQLNDLLLEFSTVSGTGEDQIRRAAIPDGAIANIARTRGIPASEDQIRRARLLLGIYAFPRGGARHGAGRKPGSGAGRSRNSKKTARRHNSSIDTGNLVINFGRELYERTGDNIWSPERGDYIVRERYTPTPEGRALGLSTWTPPLVSVSGSGGRKRFRLSQNDAQKLEACR